MKTSTLASVLCALSLALFIGCTESPRPPTITTMTMASTRTMIMTTITHDHEVGPHDGDIIELGDEEYHAELVHSKSGLTVYLLDSAMKATVPVPLESLELKLVFDGEPRTFMLAADPVEGEPQGESSRFTIADETLGEAFEEETIKGRLNVTIGDKPYVGTIDIDGDHHHHHH